MAVIPATARKIHYEEVPSDLGAAFTFREFNWPSFPFNWHYHPEVELTWIVRGRGMRFVGDSVEEFSDGDICLLGSNTPHCWASHKDAEPGVRSLVIQFRPESWGEAFWNLPELRGDWAAADGGQAGAGTPGGRAGGKWSNCFGCWNSSREGRCSVSTRSWKCCTASPKAAKQSGSRLRSSNRPPGTGASGKLGQILGYIHAHLGPELTQHEVAEAVRLSPAAFSQFFRRSLGTSYVDYVNELKIRNACRALLDTDNPITEIAFEAGFNNLSHFNAQFRRFRHVSPRVFRLQARSAEHAGTSAESEKAATPPGNAAVEASTRDLTVHGKGTNFDGVRAGTRNRGRG